MKLFNLNLEGPKVLDKEIVKLFDKEVPLRIVKGNIIGYDVTTWVRHRDKDGNILRYGDGMDDKIVRQEKYQRLELHLKTIHFDGYLRKGNHGPETTLYFERDIIFDNFTVGDTITYVGLYLLEGGVWTDYFLYNHINKHITPLYFLKTINERLFDKKHNESELRTQLNIGIERINIK